MPQFEFEKSRFAKSLMQDMQAFIEKPDFKDKYIAWAKAFYGGKKEEAKKLQEENVKNLSRKDSFTRKIRYYYFEILEARHRILMANTFIGHLPKYASYKTNDITRSRYLRYHVEVFFGEIYIIQQRINSLANELIRVCKKNKFKRSSLTISLAQEQFNRSLKNLTTIRGQHIHVARYSDDEIDRIERFELFVKTDQKDRKLNTYLKIVFSMARREWRQKIRKVTIDLDDVITIFFNQIYSPVFRRLVKKYQKEQTRS